MYKRLNTKSLRDCIGSSDLERDYELCKVMGDFNNSPTFLMIGYFNFCDIDCIINITHNSRVKTTLDKLADRFL